MNDNPNSTGFTRRGFLGVTAGLSTAAFLAACSSGGSGSGSSGSGGGGGGGGGGTLKFWDMPWGSATYNPAAKKLTEAYAPASGLPSATYQTIQWANFTQTFSSAVASNTGPAVSTGGGFQAFQYSDQGAIAYADAVVEAFKKDGTIDDFLPGTVEQMKTAKGYVAIPWQLDMRVWWYRKSIMDEVGVKVPTTWDELMTTGEALQKKGYYGFGTGSGAGNNLGAHQMVMMMINNGGGIFNEGGKVDLVTDRNIEAIDFVGELVKAKIVDPAAVSYTGDNQNNAWKTKKFAMGIDTPGLDGNIGDTSGDLLVMKPLAGPHGDKACLVFENNIMMYTNTPSQAGSEAFLQYYIKNMKTLWQQGVVPGLPLLKSIVALPEFQKQTQKVAVIKDWQPVAKSYGSKSAALGSPLAVIDAGQALNEFTQKVLTGQGDGKTNLTALQAALDAVIK